MESTILKPVIGGTGYIGPVNPLAVVRGGDDVDGPSRAEEEVVVEVEVEEVLEVTEEVGLMVWEGEVEVLIRFIWIVRWIFRNTMVLLL